MKLIIAEKPSVAFAIAKALGVKGSKDGYIENKEFIISWCVGHLVALAEPSVYDEKYAKWELCGFTPLSHGNFSVKSMATSKSNSRSLKLL